MSCLLCPFVFRTMAFPGCCLVALYAKCIASCKKGLFQRSKMADALSNQASMLDKVLRIDYTAMAAALQQDETVRPAIQMCCTCHAATYWNLHLLHVQALQESVASHRPSLVIPTCQNIVKAVHLLRICSFASAVKPSVATSAA
jgi:hypothetical protein